MNELPELWRTEIWHPLSVHFPLAIVLLGSFLLVFGFFAQRPFLNKMAKLLLVLGTVGLFLAIYTGNIADSVVSRKICDPTVLKTHEVNAYIVAWLFSIVSAMVIMEHFGFFKKFNRLLQIALVALSIIGSVFLAYTGHLGATLVYQQAAGVHIPSENCNEFIDQ